MAEWAPKRFWKATEYRQAKDGGYEVVLDDRPLQTPGRTPLVLPTEELAKLIAAEWEDQTEKVNPTVMPFTRMANSAIDRIGAQRAEVVEYIAGYGETDLLCYRAHSPAALVERQRLAWDPLLDWGAKTLGARLFATEGIIPIDQDNNAIARLTEAVESQDDFGLMGLHDMVSLSGSLILGLAAAGRVLDPDEIWKRSRIDEIWQIEQWGPDDEAADVASRKADAFFAAHRFFHSAR